MNEYISAFQLFELRDIEPRRQLTFYPFAAGDFDAIKNDTNSKVGSDIYWRPTTNTLLSATINPDFGTVESDDVVVNLTAFETFFPEKRTFFLEGQDIFNTTPRAGSGSFGRGGGGGGPPGGGGGGGFGGPGSGPMSLLNTKRIGGAGIYDIPDDVNVIATDVSAPTDLLGSVKYTGQIGNWQYGTLFAIEDDPELEGTLDDGTKVLIQGTGREYSVGRLLYEDTGGGGRRAIGWMGTNVDHPDVDATVNALDWHYFSSDNRWVVDGSAMFSDVDGVTGSGIFTDVGFRPRRGVNHSFRATWIDDELEINDVGFLVRNDQASLEYSFFMNESNIPGLRDRTTSFTLSNQWNTRGQPVRMGLFARRGWTFNNYNSVDVNLSYYPQRVDDRLGRGTGDFRIPERWGISGGFRTDRAKVLSGSLNFSLRPDEMGPMNHSTRGSIVWRPNDRFSFDLSLNYTDQEALLVHRGGGKYTSFEAHQWSPRLESNYFITAKQQLRLTMQWTGLKAFEDRFWEVNPNSRDFLIDVPNPDTTPDDFVISRMTFQVRYRWEIAPLSDLFVVYTRGSNLPRNSFMTFQDLLEQSWNDRIVDSFAIKLRYRLGS